jgi:hypothetical protein
VTREALAQALYETAWPGCRLEDALPEIVGTFARLADTAATALEVHLEPA